MIGDVVKAVRTILISVAGALFGVWLCCVAGLLPGVAQNSHKIITAAALVFVAYLAVLFAPLADVGFSVLIANLLAWVAKWGRGNGDV